MKNFTKIRQLAAPLALLLCLCACTKTQPTETTTAENTTAAVSEQTTTPAPADVALTLVENGKTTYTVIRSEEAEDSIRTAASNLYQKIKSVTGVTLKLSTDWYNTRQENLDLSGPEILVGQTNRPESAEVLASLPANSYTVTIRNEKLVILGTDNNLTAMALYEFEERILNNTEKCREGYLLFDEADSFTVTLENTFSLKEMIEGNYRITSSSKKIAHTEKQGQYGVGQGSCSDGTYVYFILRNSDDTGAVITKHRLDDGSFVAVSEVLRLGHGNDMTYDSKNHRLVAAHGSSEGQILTLVNPDTLAHIKDIGIPKGSGAITYNASRDRYAISQGGSTLHFLDSDFKWISSFTRSDKTGYTAQGMGSDDDYIYFPMSGKNDNVLVVYDWDGKYVDTLTVPVSHESESMFWVNDTYYIAYNTNGEAVYETVFEIVYE